MRSIKNNENWKGDIKNASFKNIHYNELVIRDSNIENTEFTNLYFQNCNLGFNSNYNNCTFKNCRFYGKYSSLGDIKGTFTPYFSCSFIECSFIGMSLLNGTTFTNCKFSGVFKNIILYDCKIINHKAGGNRFSFSNFYNKHILGIDDSDLILGTHFSSCDLQDLICKNLSIYGKKLFEKTKMPKKSLRFFRNTDNCLLKRANAIFSQKKEDSQIGSTLFMGDLVAGQDPLILDEFLLNIIFKSSESRELFEDIVKGYELIE